MKNVLMNRIAFTVSMLFLLTVTSCTKEDTAVKPTAQNPSGGLIKVSGEDAGDGLKSTLSGNLTVWKTSDQVGIYSPQARTMASGGVAISNAAFTAATATVSSAFTGTMYWGTGLHDFYAYYPYVSGAAASDAVPVSLASEQTQSIENSSDHIGPLDFMVATPITGMTAGTVGTATSGINLRYNHLFTILEFQIQGSGNLTKVSLSGPGTLAFSDGTIDITQPTPATGNAYTFASPGTTTGTVVVTTASTALTGTATSVYMMINPSVQSSAYTIGLYIDGVWKSLSKAPPSGGFVRGKKYTVAVNSASATALLAIGDTYGGGKVAYILQSGDPGYDENVQHGLIAATADGPTTYLWYFNSTFTTTGATGTDLGTGSANTDKIIANQGTLGVLYAARACREYTDGVYHDWYLPSKDEFNTLSVNQATIGGFTSGVYYWTSSEIDSDNAWRQSPVAGTQGARAKSSSYRVRPVRSF